MADSPDDLLPGPRILMGPGPTMADPRVLRAMATPLLGQFDPEFTAVMNEVMDLLRVVFQTRNERAFPVPGTGRAGLEAAMVSLLEPGDRVVVGECGRFGLLLIDIAERCGAEVVPVRAEWGRIIEPEAIARALGTGRTRMVAMIHGETSTGVLQPLAEIGRLARAPPRPGRPPSGAGWGAAGGRGGAGGRRGGRRDGGRNAEAPLLSARPPPRPLQCPRGERAGDAHEPYPEQLSGSSPAPALLE